MKRTVGFTLVEMLLAIVIAGTGIVAVMKLMPALAAAAGASHDFATACGLARLLIEEIDLKPFKDTADNCTFGLEADEDGATRATFDDVDDYDGYSDQPPADPDGVPDDTYAAYRRSVSVVNVDGNDLDAVCADGSTDAKRVTVTVTHDGRQVAELSVVRMFGANRADGPLLEEKITLSEP